MGVYVFIIRTHNFRAFDLYIRSYVLTYRPETYRAVFLIIFSNAFITTLCVS